MSTPTLLFGDDGSLEADRAWLWTTEQSWLGWTLDVVTCSPPRRWSLIGDWRSRNPEWRPPPPREPATGLGFESAHHSLIEADARMALADRTDAALVVIGAKGHGSLKALHLGSTAEFLAQHPPAPVVIAKKATTVRSVLVCTDDSTHAGRAVAALLAMPWIEQVERLEVIGAYLVGMYDDSAEIEAAVAATVDTLKAAPDLGCAPRPVLVEAAPAVAIPARASAMAADLVVLGTRGLSAPKRGLLWGSTSRAVIKRADSSVLMAHTS